MDKVGVVLSRVYDMQEVFKYYDENNEGFIDYKKFSIDLFSSKRVKRPISSTPTEVKQPPRNNTLATQNNNSTTAFDKIHGYLKSRGFEGSLIHFLKQFKMIDYNNSNRINIDNFIQVFSDIESPLKVNEVQLLYETYDINNNGQCFYHNFINDLKVSISLKTVI